MTIWCVCPFSRAQFLGNVLANFDQQSFGDRRLVLVTNGGAAQVSYAHPRMSLLRSPGGVSAPMNVGLAYVRENARPLDWFCKWDDDDYYGSDYLMALARVAAHGARAAARSKVFMRTPEGYLWTVDNGTKWPHGPTLAARVDASVNFPEVMGWGEDGLWWQAMVERGVEFANIAPAGFCWMRYPKGHGHAYPLQSRHFRMLGVKIEDYGEFDVRVVDGLVSKPSTPLEPMEMDMADFAVTLGGA